jgi:uncharacterized protein YuzE
VAGREAACGQRAEIREAGGMRAIEAGYVYLLPEETPFGRTVEVSESVIVDVDPDGRPIGVEVLGSADWQSALVTLAMRGRVRIT